MYNISSSNSERRKGESQRLVEVVRTRRKLGGRGITLEGTLRMKRMEGMEGMERIGNRHGGDLVMASHTIAKSPDGPSTPMALRVRRGYPYVL